jgi:pyruvate ferredoxin oxidoreductase beta subunit/2-oxoisovalerate ferredoxin oxidoreductase beta subunit
MDFLIPEREHVYSGHQACPGCGAALTVRLILQVLGSKTIAVISSSCWTNIGGAFPYTSLRIPMLHSLFAAGSAMGSGVKFGLRRQGREDINVLVIAGDGGTFDIGLQSLSGAAERNDDFIYVCYDNEGYMNTGNQRSSATPWGAWTTTTPGNQLEKSFKKNIFEIMVAHRVPYAATACPSYPEDLMSKVKRAAQLKGTKFIHVLSPCAVGWGYPTEYMVKVGRLAVESKLFPLCEVYDGIKYKITLNPKGIPVKEYLKLQNRFRYLKEEDIELIQRNVDDEWKRLVEKSRSSIPNEEGSEI